MSLLPPGTPGRESPENTEPVGERDQALFGHLFASRPARQRTLLPWLLAALIHIPIGYLFFTSAIGHRVLQQAEAIFTILTPDDNPPAIVEPPAITIVEPKLPPREKRERPGIPVAPPLVTPGPPNPNAVPTPPAATPGEPNAEGGGGSLVDRLAPPTADPRLFRPMDPSGIVNGPEASRARLADRVRQFNDSIVAERLAAERATDWTVKGEDGKRWGVSPGKLHLGDITLPLPLAFATPPGRRDEMNARTQHWSEIEAQASRAESKDNFRDRVKEIRKRRDRERAEAVADKSQGDRKKGGQE
jgi:hypothetical protein